MKGKKIISTAVALTMLVSTVIVPAEKQIKAATSASDQYKLVWSDEFVGDSLDTDIWTMQTGNWGWGNRELQNYTDRPENVKVENGNLVITIRKEVDENGEYKEYTSGRLTSSGKASFRYGKIEARIKVPGERGMWPAFWMLGQNEPKGWPYCGEIDILETWNSYSFAQGTIHFENEINKPMRDTYIPGKTNLKDKTQWHVYGMNWTPKQIEFYVDDEVYFTINIDESYMKEMHNDYYLLLNCAVGGNLPGVGPDEKFEKSEMLVDYVRVYQRDCDANKYMSTTWKEENKKAVPSYKYNFINATANISSQTLLEGEDVLIPKVTKKAYKFDGWYNSATSKKISQNLRARANTTIKAKWNKISLKKVKIVPTKQKIKKVITVKYKCKGKYDGFQVKIGKQTEETKYKNCSMYGFKSGKTYKAKVRSYAIDSRGKKIYGKWSDTVKIKAK